LRVFESVTERVRVIFLTRASKTRVPTPAFERI